MKRRFRSKILKAIYDEGVRQHFQPDDLQGTGHYPLRCSARGCGYVFTFSTTLSDGNPQKMQNLIAGMRRHGFVWQGRGGTHTAPLLHKSLRENREAAA